MRLWHKDLVRVLPKQQLIAQWRECCCIAKNVATNGTPNHLLVNKVLIYPLSDYLLYCNIVVQEMWRRGYKVNKVTYKTLCDNLDKGCDHFNNERITTTLFKDWHNEMYLRQCYYNLEEKYYCGGIEDKEWRRIVDWYAEKNIALN